MENNNSINKDLTMLSNSEIKLLIAKVENEYKGIQNNIRREAIKLSELDKEYLRLKKELNNRGGFFK